MVCRVTELQMRDRLLRLPIAGGYCIKFVTRVAYIRCINVELFADAPTDTTPRFSMPHVSGQPTRWLPYVQNVLPAPLEPQDLPQYRGPCKLSP